MLLSACSFIKINRKNHKTFTRDNYEASEKHILLMLSNQLISCSVFSKLTSKVNIIKLFDRMGNAHILNISECLIVTFPYINNNVCTCQDLSQSDAGLVFLCLFLSICFFVSTDSTPLTYKDLDLHFWSDYYYNLVSWTQNANQLFCQWPNNNHSAHNSPFCLEFLPHTTQ